MATITSVASGDWGTAGTWDSGVPVNGDSVIIAEGHEVRFDVDQSGFANGLAGLEINGILHFKRSTTTCLNMDGNISGAGEFWAAERLSIPSAAYTLVDGRTYTYSIASTVETYEIIESGVNHVRMESVNEVESTPGSYFWDSVGKKLYIHNCDGQSPDTDTILVQAIYRGAVGSEYRCHIRLNGAGIFTMDEPVKMYGWYPEIEVSQLSADAASGQNQIVLEQDMGLQQGDILAIGSSYETRGQLSESNVGLYVVSSYASATKTVVLSENLQTDRKIGDYVSQVNRGIKVSRSSGIKGVISNNAGIISGVATSTRLIYGSYTSQVEEWTVEHCSAQGLDVCLVGYGLNCTIIDCMTANFAYMQKNSLETVISNPVSISAQINNGGSTKTYLGKFQNAVLDNPPWDSNWFYECDIKNDKASLGYCRGFVDCNFLSNEITPVLTVGAQYCECINCSFDLSVDTFGAMYGKLLNCSFLGNDGVYEYLSPRRQINQIVESFDHNQLPGNYKSWTKGGTIETDTDGLGNPIPGHLIFTCESADYPVFRDFPMLLAAYKTNRWQALVNKSFTGGEVKIELIDPTSDPLIDSEATPLASYSLPDQADTNLPLKLGYKSDKAMQAILRISATNSEGTVEVDTSLIENRVQHG